MAPVRNSCVLFNDIPPPNAYPDPGKTTVYSDSETIDLEAAPLNGGFLVKTIALSIDPYLRGRMRDPGTKDHFVSTESLAYWMVTRTYIIRLASLYSWKPVSVSNNVCTGFNDLSQDCKLRSRSRPPLGASCYKSRRSYLCVPPISRIRCRQRYCSNSR